MKRLGLLVLVLAIAAGAAAGWAQWRYERDPIRFAQAPVRITVAPGATLRSIGAQLRAAEVDVPDWSLALIGRWRDDLTRIKVGTYELKPSLTLKRLVDKLIVGDVLVSEVRFIEGWTFKQMRAAMAANPDLLQDSATMSESAILEAIDVDRSKAEGLFFPSTYHFPVGSSDLLVFRQAHELMKSNLDQAWEQREPGLPLKTSYEALVLASVVEKETGTESDRGFVAGVFVNRLRINMMLQSDPTTIYGMGDRFDGDLRRRDLRADTPYNTYTRKGLPPTPISAPGRASIEAVLHPAKTKALYFVARGDGSSQFSQTLADHQAAVRRYQLKIK